MRWGVGFRERAERAPGGLVVAVRVEGEFAEELAGGGVDDTDVQVLDEELGRGSGRCLRRRTEERDEELATAREANRRLMTELNKAVLSRAAAG